MKKRIEKIQSLLKEGEAALIYDGFNRFYLTGFNSSAGWVLITKFDAVFFIDFRYFEKAKSIVDSCQVILSEKGTQQIYDFCKDKKVKTLYLFLRI